MKYLYTMLICCSVQLFGMTKQNNDGSITWVDDANPRHWKISGIDVCNELSRGTTDSRYWKIQGVNIGDNFSHKYSIKKPK